MPVLSWDTETFLIRHDLSAPPLVCVSWAVPGAAGIFKHDGDGIGRDPRGVFREWLVRPIVGHNVAYDLGVVAAEWPELMPEIFEALAAGRVHDTMLREKLRDIAFGEFRWRHLPDGTSEKVNYHLADLSARRTGVVLQKGEDTWRLRYGELHGVPLAAWPPEASGYSVKDSTTALAVFEAQEKERADLYARTSTAPGNVPGQLGIDLFHDEPAQVRAAFWMQLMGAWGMPLDPTRVDALADAITMERDGLEKILIEEGLVRIEHYSPRARNGKAGLEKKRTRDSKAAQAYMVELCAEMGVPPKATAKGGVCVDAEACEDTGDLVMIAYAHYSALGNVLGKDVKAMRGMSRIHGSYDTLVASGRTSSRSQKVQLGGKEVRIGLNLQNLRVDGHTRECFVAPPGSVFCLIDLTAAELYAVAQICIRMFGRSRLAEVLNSDPPMDPHVHLAATLTGRAYADLIACIKQGDSEAKNRRQVCKSANYGLWGGMRAKRFAALVKRQTHGKVLMTEAEANALRQAFLATWPEAPQYLAHFERMCSRGKRGTVVQEKSGRIRGGLHYSEACNTPFQGLIADLMKDAGFRLSREMYDRTRESILFGSRIVNFPHDELISLVPEENAHDCAMRIQEIVLGTGREWIPDVPPRGEVYLARYWSKKAKPVHGPDGKLLPWDGREAA